jgi:hypothetical protein
VNQSDLDLNGIAAIPDFSTESLRAVIDRLERSTRFQHYILRADELDAVGRHIDLAIASLPAGPGSASESARLEHLRSVVLKAHEKVDSGSPGEAAELLRPFAG